MSKKLLTSIYLLLIALLLLNGLSMNLNAKVATYFIVFFAAVKLGLVAYYFMELKDSKKTFTSIIFGLVILFSAVFILI